MTSTMAQAEASSRRPNPRLRGVEVTYVDERPLEKMDFVIIVGDQEQIKRKSVAETGTITCNMLCPRSSTLTIRIRETRKTTFSRTERVETLLDSIDAPLQDERKTVNIKLFFSGIFGTVAEEDARRRRDAADAKAKAEERPVILDKLETVRFFVDNIEPIGEALSEVHPGVKGAFVAVELLMKVCERQEACRNAAIALTDEWDGLLSLIEYARVLREKQESRKAVEHLLKTIDDVSDYIINHTPTGVFGGLLWRKYNKKIEDFKRELANAIGAFDRNVLVEAMKGIEEAAKGIDGVMKGIDEADEKLLLKELKPATYAHYKPEEQCLKDTRMSLRGKARHWLQTPSSSAVPPPLSAAQTPSFAAKPRVFWLCGTGGSGKTYVANTVAAIVDEDADLDLSCYFCKRDDEELSQPKRFFPTLASHIAKYNPAYQSALVAFLRSSQSDVIVTGGVSTHYKMLFGDLLPKIKAPVRTRVIVIDALDECGSPPDQGELAKYVLALAEAAPWIKIFITSRPVEEIRKCFSSKSLCTAVNINDEAETYADIRHFIEAEVKSIEAEQETTISLSSTEIDQLVRQAAGLFIWASTMFKYVRTSRKPRRELQIFLSEGAPKEPLEQLYELYDQVLTSALNVGHKDDVEVLHTVLGIVFISAGNRPLSIEALSQLLRADQAFMYEDGASVRKMTGRLHAVLYEDMTTRGALRVSHPSFLDFLELKLKDWFESGAVDIHRLLSKGCLATMHAELKFNICQLEDSTLLNKDVLDLKERISTSISEALDYSSLFCFSHLSQSGLKDDKEVISSLSELLYSRKFLFWLEVLSVLGAVGRGAAILRDCVQFFEGSPDIADVISDLEKFVLSSSEAMQSAPHIYLSALTWVPEETLTQKKIAAQFKNLHWITRKEASWEGTRWVKSVGEAVHRVACSPDGLFVAAGMDGSVRILDSGTGEPAGEPLQCDGWVESIRYSADGERVTIVSSNTVTTWNIKTGDTVRDPIKLKTGDTVRNPFKRNLDDIIAAAISPDGSLIACGSRRGVLSFFDARTGAAVGEPLSGHTDEVESIAFSPDGQHVVSGSLDSIRIWDVKTRTAVGNPLEGQSGTVFSVSYSPDGRWIVSGSWDKTVRIWNAQTGAALFEPLRGHTNSVLSVALSLDGRWVASGSRDGTIRTWNTNTGMAVGAPLQGHSGRVESVAFLPDSRHIISGSEDTTVRIWDVGFSSTAGAASEGHSDSVTSVSFSPDGERIASGSWDRTVRIWNTKTGVAIGGALEGHEDEIKSVCFSPDGLLIASASDDKTIRFWDAITGAEFGEPLADHTSAVMSIAFSPDGQHVVSGSLDKTIRIWDVKTRTAVGNPLKGQSGVQSVSFSPDGRCIVSGSENGIVCLWNAQTGAALFNPLRRGHSEKVTSVVFSLDGRLVASGSLDETVRIWDAKTGAAIGDPLQCHHMVHSVAFSLDSRRIVSGEREIFGDGEIRIWDVETRAEIAGPLRGHSGLVTAVAFSPDGQHIASGSFDHTVRIWDAVDRGDTDAQWNEYCARMNVEDGWVKDEEKLLLWIPHRYRENFRNWRLQVCIRRGAQSTTRPMVDLEKLFAYTGTGWTQIYES